MSKLASGVVGGAEGARDRIVNSAVDLVSDFGVRRFTVDELAKRVGLSRVTIYRHFPSKDEVLEAALLHELRAFMTDVEGAVAAYDTVEERIVEGFVLAVSHLRSHAVLQRLLRTEPELILPLLTTHGSPMIATGQEFIANFARDAAALNGTPLASPQLEILSELLARLIMSLVLTPDSVAPMESDAELRTFAERYVGGIVRSFSATPVMPGR